MVFVQAHQAEEDGLGESALTLQVHMGLAWTVGCVAFGLIVVRNSVECRIARQYLCQASVFMCGVSILALTTVRGDRQGYVMFAWVYGMFCGGYHYSLKMYTYERVRARNFARTWGFVQCSQAIPIALGVPISGKKQLTTHSIHFVTINSPKIIRLSEDSFNRVLGKGSHIFLDFFF